MAYPMLRRLLLLVAFTIAAGQDGTGGSVVHAQEAVAKEEVEVGVSGEATATETNDANATPPTVECDCTAESAAAVRAAEEAAAAREAELQASLEESQKEISEARASGEQAASEQAVALQSDLDAAREKIASLEAELAGVRKDLADSVTSHNDAHQKSTSLQQSLERLRSEKDSESKELQSTIDELKKDADRQKSQLKKTNDEVFTTRRELFDAHSELRDMHSRAVTQYVNFTLMREDSSHLAGNALSKASEHLAAGWEAFSTKAGPLLERAQTMYEVYSKKASEGVSPHVEQLQRSAAPHVQQAKDAVHPLMEKVQPHVDAVVEKFGPPASEAIEGVRLSAISAVEQSSRAGLTYLKSVQVEKKVTRGDAAPEPEPSAVQLHLISALEYASKNAEDIVREVSIALPLVIVMVWSRSVIFGSLALFLGLPIWSVWCFCLVRLMTGGKRTKGQQVVSETGVGGTASEDGTGMVTGEANGLVKKNKKKKKKNA